MPLRVASEVPGRANALPSGERDCEFFVIRSGEVEVLDPSGDTPKTLVIHRTGSFTGEVPNLTGSPSLVTAVARTGCDVLAVASSALQELLNRCPELSDLVLQAYLARRQLMRESGSFTGLRVIGSRYSQDTFRIRDFLARNRAPFTWLDLEADPQVSQLLQQFGLSENDTPVVAWGRLLLLRNPSNRQLAEAIGVRRPIEAAVYDLVVVGGRAGGAGSGGVRGVRGAPHHRPRAHGARRTGWQQHAYRELPGLPHRDHRQRARRSGRHPGGQVRARLSIPAPVVGLTFEHGYPILRLDTGETVTARSVLIATGADYRRLDVEGCSRFEGCGVYYAATPNEAQLCKGSDVVVVGGGNSAGQAAVFLAQQSRAVYLVIRGDSLDQDMSSYLARRIERTSNIEVLVDTTAQRLLGDRSLRAVEILDSETGARRTLEIAALFSFIGEEPRTDWLPPEIEKDAQGFVRTGAGGPRAPSWDRRREPFLLETSRPGVFAAGDVRAGSIKRVASAVGEGDDHQARSRATERAVKRASIRSGLSHSRGYAS